KAIDLIDEAGAKMRISMMNQPKDINNFESEIEEVRLAKEDAISKQEYEKAASLRDKEKSLRERLQKLRTEWEVNKKEQEVIVDEDDDHFLLLLIYFPFGAQLLQPLPQRMGSK